MATPSLGRGATIVAPAAGGIPDPLGEVPLDEADMGAGRAPPPIDWSIAGPVVPHLGLLGTPFLQLCN
jgi:hypothetical protein